jgi:hypothetical protein
MAKLVEEWWQEPGEGDQAIEAHHLEFETLDKDFDYAISTSVLYLSMNSQCTREKFLND